MIITLPADTRYFERYNNRQLFWTGDFLEQGSSIRIGQMAKLIYDHRDQDVVAFNMNNQEYYLIVEEIGISGLAEKLQNQPTLSIIK